MHIQKAQGLEEQPDNGSIIVMPKGVLMEEKAPIRDLRPLMAQAKPAFPILAHPWFNLNNKNTNELSLK